MSTPASTNGKFVRLENFINYILDCPKNRGVKYVPSPHKVVVWSRTASSLVPWLRYGTDFEAPISFPKTKCPVDEQNYNMTSQFKDSYLNGWGYQNPPQVEQDLEVIHQIQKDERTLDLPPFIPHNPLVTFPKE